MFEIPKSFNLAGQLIEIEKHENLYKEQSALGKSIYIESKIFLDSGTSSKLQQEQVFCHELIHWIFFIMNEDGLRTDEKKVDIMAHLLHQALTTASND
jgi:hypothetical protein